MSYSATWQEVRLETIDADLAIDKATCSPPLEQMADDVKEAVAAAARGAALMVDALPTPPTGAFKVSAYGHVRQGEQDGGSTGNISVGECVEVLPTAEEAAAQIGAVEPDIETTEPPASG